MSNVHTNVNLPSKKLREDDISYKHRQDVKTLFCLVGMNISINHARDWNDRRSLYYTSKHNIKKEYSPIIWNYKYKHTITSNSPRLQPFLVSSCQGLPTYITPSSLSEKRRRSSYRATIFLSPKTLTFTIYYFPHLIFPITFITNSSSTDIPISIFFFLQISTPDII